MNRRLIRHNIQDMKDPNSPPNMSPAPMSAASSSSSFFLSAAGAAAPPAGAAAPPPLAAAKAEGSCVVLWFK